MTWTFLKGLNFSRVFNTSATKPPAAGPRLRRRAPSLHVEQLETRLTPAVLTPFAPRFTANAPGDIVFAANTLMTAPSSDSGAQNARNGTGSRLNDNDFNMVYVDADTDATTFNSSFASLNLPAG